MDSQLNAAARALAQGDALAALKHVALREDAPGVALRGIALAQLGDLTKARELLRKARRRFGANEAVAKARCLTAENEVALALRELAASTSSDRSLAEAIEVLERHGDAANATHARLLDARRKLLLGRPDRAEQALESIDLGRAPPMLAAVGLLLRADIELRETTAC